MSANSLEHGPRLCMPADSPNRQSVIIGTRRYVVECADVAYLTPGANVHSMVFVPIEVPEEMRRVWAAGFLSGSKRRVHDRDLPRTCDDPPPSIDGQPNLVKPLSAERR